MLRLSRMETRLFATLLLGVSPAALAPVPAHAASGTVTELGSLGGNKKGYGSETNSNGVSNDDSIVVGDAIVADNSSDHAFRWTQAGGMVDLGTLAGTYSFASAVSG